jgi:hypothetical protein
MAHGPKNSLLVKEAGLSPLRRGNCAEHALVRLKDQEPQPRSLAAAVKINKVQSMG